MNGMSTASQKYGYTTVFSPESRRWLRQRGKVKPLLQPGSTQKQWNTLKEVQGVTLISSFLACVNVCAISSNKIRTNFWFQRKSWFQSNMTIGNGSVRFVQDCDPSGRVGPPSISACWSFHQSRWSSSSSSSSSASSSLQLLHRNFQITQFSFHFHFLILMFAVSV